MGETVPEGKPESVGVGKICLKALSVAPRSWIQALLGILGNPESSAPHPILGSSQWLDFIAPSSRRGVLPLLPTSILLASINS